MADIIASLIFEVVLMRSTPATVTETLNKCISEMQFIDSDNNQYSIQYDAILNDTSNYCSSNVDTKGVSGNYIFLCTNLEPTVNFTIFGNAGLTNLQGVCDAETIERIGKERIYRPDRLISKKLLNPIDVSLGLFQASIDSNGFIQTYLFSTNETSVDYGASVLEQFVNNIFTYQVQRDFSNIIIAGTFIDQNNKISPSHAAVLTLDHKNNRLILMEFAGLNGIYQIIQQNGQVTANPLIFGNLTQNIYCLNELDLQCPWSCGYWTIEYLRAANRKKYISSIIMDDKKTIANNLKLRLRPSFFNEVRQNIEKIDIGLKKIALNKFGNDNPNICGYDKAKGEIDELEESYINDNEYYLLNSRNCNIYYQELEQSIDKCF